MNEYNFDNLFPTIKSIKLSNYKFFYGDDEKNNKFDFNGKSALIYGENGSGKSSLYKAIELLTKEKIEPDYFTDQANIFIPQSIDSDLNDVSVKFIFSNDREYIFNKDVENTPLFQEETFDFIKKLHIFKPMLDYKKLLKLHYNSEQKKDMNIYSIIEEILKDYPLEDKTPLFDKDPIEMTESLNKVLNGELLNYIHHFLKYFDSELKIDKFNVKIIRDKTSNTIIPFVNIILTFKNLLTPDYHLFLNEARLSELAISIYFASIKKLFSLIENNCIKILVLDDLLLSLDMSNRVKLLNILKEEFQDFQILFFTHDKELFEMYKDKIDWVKYEIYCDNSSDIPKPILKKNDSYLERAKEFYALKDYDISASFLRKAFEEILKKILDEKIKSSEILEHIKLENLIFDALSFSFGEVKKLLENLNRDKKHILNPSSHDDNKPIYSEELRNSIKDIESLKNWKPKIKKILPKYTNLKLTFKDSKDETQNYIFNLIDNLYIYKKDEKIELYTCECNTLYCYIGENNNKFEYLKYEENYNSILELYKSILEYEKIELNQNYYDFISYKNKNGKWIELSKIIVY